MSTSKMLKSEKKSLNGQKHHVKMQKWLISDHFFIPFTVQNLIRSASRSPHGVILARLSGKRWIVSYLLDKSLSDG